MRKLKFCKLLTIITLAIVSILNAEAKDDSVLYFKNDTAFKIVQFTDIHWKSNKIGNETNLATIRDVLDREQPDLVVFTGDIVLSKHYDKDVLTKGWSEVTAPLRERKIKWVATLGNHDSEGDVPRESLYNFIINLPYNINSKVETRDFVLPVLTLDKKLSSALYIFDSGEYAKRGEPGKYAWIKREQINNYKQVSDQLKDKNNGNAIPSLAFFHIPLPEYAIMKEELRDNGLLGHCNEKECSPVINSGLFAAMRLQGDVMGVFCGHDHNNDYIGEYYNIALAYGRCSGVNAYGKLRNGARTIVLHPQEHNFDTWITIPTRTELFYHYPTKKN